MADLVYEAYLDRVGSLFGRGDRIVTVTAPDEEPAVHVLCYEYPGDREMLAISYGVSSVPHPDWQASRPELVMHVSSLHQDWPIFLGFIAKAFRGAKPYRIGSVLGVPERILEETAMSYVILFLCSCLTPDECLIEMPDRTVHLVQAYPMYAEEIEVVEAIGPTDFMTKTGIDFFDVRRPPCHL